MGEHALPEWWPRCRRCDAPVTRMAWSANPAPPATITLRMECHGEAKITVSPWEMPVVGKKVVAT